MAEAFANSDIAAEIKKLVQMGDSVKRNTSVHSVKSRDGSVFNKLIPPNDKFRKSVELDDEAVISYGSVTDVLTQSTDYSRNPDDIQMKEQVRQPKRRTSRRIRSKRKPDLAQDGQYQPERDSQKEQCDADRGWNKEDNKLDHKRKSPREITRADDTNKDRHDVEKNNKDNIKVKAKNQNKMDTEKEISDKPPPKQLKNDKSNVQGHAAREKINAIFGDEFVCAQNVYYKKERIKELEKQYIFLLKKKSTKFPLAKFFCRLCDYHCFDLEHCESHMKDSRHRRLRKIRRIDQLLSKLPQPEPAHIQAVTDTIERVYDEQHLKEDQLKERQELLRRVQQLINNANRNIQLVMYGSSRSTLGIKSSDVNMDFLNSVPPSYLKDAYLQLKENQNQNNYVEDVQSDFTAKVPCVRFTVRDIKLKCQLGINNTCSHQTAELLHIYSKIDSRLTKLAVAFRYLGKLCKMDKQEAGSLPSYVFYLMTVFFLQQCQPPVLPVLHEIGKPEDSGTETEDWYFKDLDKLSEYWKCTNKCSVGELWIKMLRFYCIEFDLSNYVINVRQKKPLSRQEKKWTSRKLAIEDPFMRRRNIARCVSHSQVFEYITEHLKIAYKYFGIPQLKTGPLFVDMAGLESYVEKRKTARTSCYSTKEAHSCMSMMKTLDDAKQSEGNDIKPSQLRDLQSRMDGEEQSEGHLRDSMACSELNSTKPFESDCVSQSKGNILTVDETDDIKQCEGDGQVGVCVSKQDVKGDAMESGMNSSPIGCEPDTGEIIKDYEQDMVDGIQQLGVSIMNEMRQSEADVTNVNRLEADATDDGKCLETNVVDGGFRQSTDSCQQSEINMTVDVKQYEVGVRDVEQSAADLTGAVDHHEEDITSGTKQHEMDILEGPDVAIGGERSTPDGTMDDGLSEVSAMCTSTEEWIRAFVNEIIDDKFRTLPELNEDLDDTEETEMDCDFHPHSSSHIYSQDLDSKLEVMEESDQTSQVNISKDQRHSPNRCVSESPIKSLDGCNEDMASVGTSTEKLETNKSESRSPNHTHVGDNSQTVSTELNEPESTDSVGTEANTSRSIEHVNAEGKLPHTHAMWNECEASTDALVTGTEDNKDMMGIDAANVSSGDMNNDNCPSKDVQLIEAQDDLSNHRAEDQVSDYVCDTETCNRSDGTSTISTNEDVPDVKDLEDRLTKDVLEPEEMIFCFDEDNLADSKGPAIMCSICQKEGHLKSSCPEENLPPLRPLPPLSPTYMSVLNDVIHKVPGDFKPTEREMELRRAVVCEVEKAIQERYPGAKLEVFGSSCNGFGFRGSDLDICLTFAEKPSPASVDPLATIEQLAKVLKKQKTLYNVFPITTAKVPIVKFKHRPLQLEGDISLYNTLAIENTRMLRLYSAIDKRVVYLGYMMKVLAKICDICDASRGSLSSYAYILMVIYFLQQRNPPVIPVLQQLKPKKMKQTEKIIDGWNAWFFDDIKKLKQVWPDYGKNQESAAELWLGLLSFYTEKFSFKEYVISIRQKVPVTKFEKLWNNSTIAIEDPFDLNHNLGAGLSRRMNMFIIRTLRNARKLFGTNIHKIPDGYRTLEDYLFDPNLLTDSLPPSDRNCHHCGKIGHFAKECPMAEIKKEGEEEKRRQKQQQQRQQQAQWHQMQQQRAAEEAEHKKQGTTRSMPQNTQHFAHMSSSSDYHKTLMRQDYKHGKQMPENVQSMMSVGARYSPASSKQQHQPVYVQPSPTQGCPLLPDPPQAQHTGLACQSVSQHQSLYSVSPQVYPSSTQVYTQNPQLLQMVVSHLHGSNPLPSSNQGQMAPRISNSGAIQPYSLAYGHASNKQLNVYGKQQEGFASSQPVSSQLNTKQHGVVNSLQPGGSVPEQPEQAGSQRVMYSSSQGSLLPYNVAVHPKQSTQQQPPQQQEQQQQQQPYHQMPANNGLISQHAHYPRSTAEGSAQHGHANKHQHGPFVGSIQSSNQDKHHATNPTGNIQHSPYLGLPFSNHSHNLHGNILQHNNPQHNPHGSLQGSNPQHPLHSNIPPSNNPQQQHPHNNNQQLTTNPQPVHPQNNQQLINPQVHHPHSNHQLTNPQQHPVHNSPQLANLQTCHPQGLVQPRPANHPQIIPVTWQQYNPNDVKHSCPENDPMRSVTEGSINRQQGHNQLDHSRPALAAGSAISASEPLHLQKQQSHNKRDGTSGRSDKKNTRVFVNKNFAKKSPSEGS